MIDCGFLAMPAAGEFEATYLFHDSLVAVLPPEHPLAHEPCFPVARLPLDVTQFREVGVALKRDAAPSAVTSLFLEHAVPCMKNSGFLEGLNKRD